MINTTSDIIKKPKTCRNGFMYKDENHYTLYKRGPYWGYYYYDDDNKRHFRSTGRKTRHEALRVINDRIKKEELRYDSRKSSITLAEYARDFFLEGKCPILKEKERSGHAIAKTSAYLYRMNLERYILPMLGTVQMSRLTSSSIRGFQDKLSEELGLRNVTINSAVATLRTIVKRAIVDEVMDRNPFDKITERRNEESSRKAFTLDQVRLLLSSKWSNGIAMAAFKTACLTGMRIGEIQALKPSALKGDYIEVSASYSDALHLEKCPKNGKTRTVPFPEQIRDDLALLASDRSDGMYLFSTNGKVPISKGLLLTTLKSQMRICGIDDPGLTFHSARYFFDSYMYLHAGVDKERIKKVIGHSSDAMFRHYLTIEQEDLSPIRQAQDNIIDNTSK